MKNPIQMIKQCVEKEEPYFVLRGQDRCALAAVEAYYEAVRQQVNLILATRNPATPSPDGRVHTEIGVLAG